MNSKHEKEQDEQGERIEPEDLAALVDEMPRKMFLREYYPAMNKMRSKGYSFANIAEWMSKQLGIEVTRSQVTYILTTPPEVQFAEDEEEDNEDRAAELQ